MNKNIKRAGIVGGVIGAVVVGGVAFAAFTSTGHFGATGKVHDAPVEITAGPGSIEALYPGGCSDVTVSFVNPNDHDAKVDISKIGASTLSLTQNDGGKAVFNPNLISILQGLQSAGTAFTVPANSASAAAFTIPNMVCLSTSATNTDAGAQVALSGTVPFALANDSEYQG